MEKKEETRYPTRLLYGFIALTGMLFAGLMYVSYMADSSLGSEDAIAAVERYKRYALLLKLICLLGFTVLLAYANFYFIRNKVGGLLFIVAFIVPALFINIYYSYLSEIFFLYRRTHGLWEGEFSMAPLKGLIISALLLAFVGANYMVLKTIINERKNRKGKLSGKPTKDQPVPPQSGPN